MKHFELTSDAGWLEDIAVGQKMRHFRGVTIDEVENNYLMKQVMNTAQAHRSKHAIAGAPLDTGGLVFGRITASRAIGFGPPGTWRGVSPTASVVPQPQDVALGGSKRIALTASMLVGLASHDNAENAPAELGLGDC
jgi:hypothetical protein